MNIIKLQDELRSVPDNALIGYVQNPTGNVPSYLALSELQRRKDMRTKYEAQQTPQSSVADDLEQQATPQAQPQEALGVAGLPIPDQMFSGQGMAAGGIVAFEDGGDVAASDAAPSDMASTTSTAPSYADMSYDALIASGVHPLNAAGLKGMLPPSRTYTGATAGPAFASSSPYGTDMIGEMMRVSPEAFRYSYGVGRGTSPYAGAAFSAIRKEMGSPGYADGGMVAFGPGGDVASKKYQALLEDSYLSPGSLYAGAKDLLGMPFQYRVAYDPTTDKYMSRRALEGNTPNLDMYRKAAELRKQGLLAEADTLEKTASSPRIDRPGLAALDNTAAVDNKLTNEDIGNIYRSTTPTPTKARPAVLPAAADTDVTKPAPGPAPQPKEAGITSLLEDTDGLAEKRMARYKQMVGEDPERARLEELSKKYDASATEQERIAPYMALAKAGFGMAAGKSPFALQNLAEGAQAGLADYAQARDKLDKLTEKQIDIRTKMGQAKRAEDIAGATYGLNSEAAVEARNAQVKLKDMEEKSAFTRTKYAADVSTKNAMIAAAKKSDYETFIELAKQDNDNYKTVKDKDGNVKKVFDANKVTQSYKAFSGSSGLDDDKLFTAYQQEKMMDKNFNLSFQEYRDRIRGQSGSPISAMPAGIKVTRTQ